MTQELKLNENGLIPAIAQHHETGQVLMMAYVSPDSLKHTIESNDVWFYSRSRQALWHKGEESGNYLHVKSAWVDCDGDTLLLKVEPTGPVCHTGNKSCFFQPMEGEQEYEGEDKGSGILDELFSVIQERKLDRPEGSYTVRLLESGVERIAQKVIEEAGEAARAGATMNRENLPKEVADLLYHTLVLLSASEVSLEEVWKELRERRG